MRGSAYDPGNVRITGGRISGVTLGAPAGLTKSDVGLGNVDNTSDANKPVSTAQQTALDLKANAANAALTGTTSAAALTMSGLLTLSAGQISFPATQNPSAGANVLDDYEEGTWTPVPTSLTVVGTPTYAGYYTKIGNYVFGTADISATTSTASTANTTYFTGIPFAPAQRSGCPTVGGNTASYGVGLVDTNSRVQTPTWGATGSTVTVSFSYRV